MSENPKVVTLDDRRPHTTGPAKCMKCKHEWDAVVPAKLHMFDCPECGFESGMFHNYQVQEEAVWVCNCGNAAFEIAASGYALCINCGVTQELDELL